MSRNQSYSRNAHDRDPEVIGGAKLRLLIVAPSIDILGGQAVQAARLLEGLRLEPSLEVGFLPINPRLPGVLRRLQSLKYLRTLATSIAYILSLLERVPQYDIIHIFSASYLSFVLAPTPALLISKFYGKRTLLNYHSGYAADHLALWRRTALPTMKLADLIVVQSRYLVDVFADFGLTVESIPNHLDFNRLRYRSRVPLRPAFLTNRNFEPRYSVASVLRAFAFIQGRWPGASLRVAGDGSQREELKLLASSLALQNTIFVGALSPTKMAELYDECDVYLNASEVDSMPLSILEAQACGLPVVTTGSGGIPYLVKDELTGLVVPTGDHESMAKCALRLMEDQGFAHALAERARAECEKFSWPCVGRQWLSAYIDLARNPAAEGKPKVMGVNHISRRKKAENTK